MAAIRDVSGKWVQYTKVKEWSDLTTIEKAQLRCLQVVNYDLPGLTNQLTYWLRIPPKWDFTSYLVPVSDPRYEYRAIDNVPRWVEITDLMS